MFLLDFDELNAAWNRSDKTLDDFENYMVIGYVLGVYQAASDILKNDDEDIIDELLDISLLDKAMKAEIDGKTFRTRFESASSEYDQKRLLETEYHRMFETGEYDTAEHLERESGQKIYKKWVTMHDNKVRDTHDYLEGMKVPLNERFFTYDGDSARFPSDFKNAENNVNCRCYLSYGFENEAGF